MANLDALHQLYLSRPPVRALFDSIQTHGVEDGRTTVDELTQDGALSRRQAINLLRELAELGCGEFKVGRKGHPSRLEWSDEPSDLIADAIQTKPEPEPEPERPELSVVLDETTQDSDADEPRERTELELQLHPTSEPEAELQRTFDLGDDASVQPTQTRRRGKSKRRAARAPESTAASIEHVFVLRPDTRISVELPADLSAKEAEVLANWVRSLSFER